MSRARWAAYMTSSKRLGTCRMQSSTVTAVMSTSVRKRRVIRGLPQNSIRQLRWGFSGAGSRSYPLCHLVRRQGRHKFADGLAGYGVPPIRRQVGQGTEDEGPADHARMRQDRPTRPTRGDFPMIIEQIEVDRPGG